MCCSEKDLCHEWNHVQQHPLSRPLDARPAAAAAAQAVTMLGVA